MMLETLLVNVNTAAIVLADITPTPTPTQFAKDGTPLGSPGFLGFVCFFILAVAVIFLMLDMNRRARRMRYRNEYAMAREAEERAARGSDPAVASVADPIEQTSPRSVADRAH